MSDRNLKGKVLKLRYGLTTRVSERGAGGVYLGWDEDEGVQVVVRVPHEDLLDDDEFIDRFLAGDRTPAGIPGLANVIEVDRSAELPYAIVEYVEGETLRERMKSAGGRLAVTDILPCIESVGETLARLHDAGVVHRGVSPRSLIVTADGATILTDVAVASALTEAPSAPEVLEPRAYAAPEARTTSFGPLADQYSLAATVATAVMGDGYLSRQAHKGMAQSLASRIPSAAAAVLVRALDPDEDARYPDVAAFVREFVAGVQEGTGTSSLGEGTSTMMLGDVATILETTGSVGDDEDVPVAEVLPPAESMVDERAGPEPAKEPVPEPVAAPTGFRGKWLLLVAGVFAVALVAGSWYVMGPGKNTEPGEPTDVVVTPVEETPDEKPAEPATGKTDETVEVAPPVLAAFSATLSLDRDAVPELTREESVEISGRLVDGPGGWIEAGRRRIDPDDSGAFKASVPLSEGENTLEIRFFDRHGRAGKSETFRIERDTIGPKVTLTSPTGSALTGRTEVELVGRVVDDHPREVRVGSLVARVEDRQFRVTVPLPAEGPNDLEIYGVDTAGNNGDLMTLRMTRDTLDPVIEIDSPKEGAVLKEDTVVVRGRVVDPHLSGVTLNDKPLEIGENGSFEEELPVEEGAVVLRFVAEDTLGHKASQERRFSRDVSGPAVTITEPVDKAYVRERKVTVKGRVQDPNPGTVEVNGTTADLDDDGWFDVEIELEPGEREIRVIATDSVGNPSEPVVLTITVDESGPEILLSSVPATVEGETVTITGTVSEDRCAIQVAGVDAVVTGRKFRAEVKLTAVGDNPIEIVATDRVGNPTKKTVTVYRKPPGPPPGASFLTALGPDGRLNDEKPAAFPVGLEAGSLVDGPATIETPEGDVITVNAGANVVVQEKLQGVHGFILSMGSATGLIGRSVSLGMPRGWFVVFSKGRTEFRAAVMETKESRFKVIEGSGEVKSGPYSVMLGSGQATRVLETAEGDFRFMSAGTNATPVILHVALPGRLSVFARVPGSVEGKIERLSEGRRFRLSFETVESVAKPVTVWTKKDDKPVDTRNVAMDETVIVRVLDSPGELRIREKE